MDVDEDENTTQRPRKALDYGIVVDFDDVAEEDLSVGSPFRFLSPVGLICDTLLQRPDWGAQLDTSIAKISAEIEHMAPNMKAIERLDDVENKLRDAENEADDAKRESKAALT